MPSEALPHGERTLVLFAHFALDTEARLLARRGRPVALSTKAIDVLIQLVAKAPRVVSRGHLMASVWPDRVVDDNHLTHIVADLRRVLGPRLSRAIRTVHGVGFAFTLPVEARPAPGRPEAREAVWDLSWAPGSRASLQRGPAGGHETWPGGHLELAVGRYTVGRAPGCTPRLASRTVSGRHALLSVEKDAVFVEDLGSKNGTYLDGRRIAAKTRVPESSVVTMGAVAVRLRRHEDPAETTDPMDASPTAATPRP
jgi:DNA-binding winged helix-turn-helix (wHTH) protein